MSTERALALGALVGLLVALAPSCSGSTCNPNTCGGCCDGDRCVARPNNANNDTCGSAGRTCSDCTASGQVCDELSFTCTAGTGTGDGGPSDGGCAGCRLPNGACAPGNTNANCGSGGLACTTCPVGQLCTGGSCSVPTLTKRVGSPCTLDSECRATLGSSAICKTMTSSGNASYLSGYCTIDCANPQVQCPSGSECVPLDPRYGETDVFCWDQCSSGDPCRTPGYACYPFTGGGSGCWVSPLPAEDAGRPADKVGNACTADSQCINPPDNGGACMLRELSRAWPDGYCSRVSCSANSECSEDGGAFCLSFRLPDSTRESWCVRRCGVEGGRDGGQADCRAGYVCNGYSQADAGPSPDGYCAPPIAPPPERTGAACTLDSDCQAPAGTVADCIPERLPELDGGLSGYPGGYCTRLDCRTDAECGPNGSGLCLFVTPQVTACFQGCPVGGGGQQNCRANYVCVPFGLPGGGSSDAGYCDSRCDAPGSGCPTGRTCNTTTGYCQ